MMFIEDERGVQPIIGAIFVFALIILLLGTLQTFAVPNQTAEVEFKHSQDVQADMTSLESAISQTASLGSELTTRIDIGTQYPSRFILLNPPAATGNLRTEAAGNVTLSHVVATQSTETADFLDGTEHNYTTRRIIYAPQYNRFSGAPDTVVATGVVYDQYGSRTLTESENLVDGKRINLVIVDGNVSETGLNTKVRTDPLSAPTETVAVTNATGQHVNITLATQLNASTWADILDEDINGGHVEDVVDAGGDRVTVVMEQGVTYQLRMAKVGVGPDATAPGPEYMTDVRGNGSGIPENGRQELVVQVRDKYNNPVVGEEVEFGIESFDTVSDDGELLDGPNPGHAVVRTDERGRAVVTYEAPAQVAGSPREVEVNATYDTFAMFDDRNAEDVGFKLRVINGTQVDRNTPLFNPSEGVIVTDAEIANTACPGIGNVECQVDVTFEHTGTGTATVEEARYTFYSEDEQGKVGVETHAQVVVENSDTLEISDEFQEVDYDIDDSGTTLKFEFEDDSNDPAEVEPGDYFVISFVVDGQRSTYFIAPQDES